MLSKNKTAIVLVPEISLTPQMVDRFLARFGNCISVLHSRLSIGERYDAWNKIQKGETKIVIGARSAIFAPIQNLGVVIIDEEHDSSYKSDMSPRYNAKEISKYICKENNAVLVLGSATPDIKTYELANRGEIDLIKLTKRANKSNLPNVEVVDLRGELANGNKSMISEKLKSLIEQNIKNKYQTILFLNRRGFSTFVMCRECGFVLKCRRCNITMTYHLHDDKLKCHYCGYERENVKVCPNCSSTKIKHFGIGTQKLEEEIKKIFPEATTIRMDVDTTSKKNSHEQILEKFKNENIDILIGTQMVVKGHHFPKCTLVGVIAADSGLNIEDYRSNEITFQILTQVAGRAGRENLPGEVIVQTYNPDSFSIGYAKEQDYESFYNAEINIRKQLKYPPFLDIVVIGVSSLNQESVKEAVQKLYEILNKNENQNVQIFKPLPAPISKIKNRYRFRIIIKCKFGNNMISFLNNAFEEYNELKYRDVRVIVDVNPNNMI